MLEEVGVNEEYADSAAGFDGSSNTSGSLYAEKHDTSSIHEIDSIKSNMSVDLAGLGQSPPQDKAEQPDHRFSAHGTSDWVPGWGSDYSADNDLAIAYEENSKLRGCLEVAESSIHELKMEVSSLQTHADEIGNEAQNFAQKLAGEIATGELLSKEVSVLKLECSKLKQDLATLSKIKSYSSTTSREGQNHQLQDSQFHWLKGLSVIEDKIQGFHRKACLGFHERDFRTLQTELEALLSLLQNLKQETSGADSKYYLLAGDHAGMSEIKESSSNKSDQFVSGTRFDTEFYQPDIDMLHSVSVPGLVSHEPNALNAMESKLFDLLRELEDSKAERDSLTKKMDQMECYYENLIVELEENQRQLLGELQNLRNEHSGSLYTISSAKDEMETMRQNLNEQMMRFSEEKSELNSVNKELERRALSAEAAFKRARLNYSIAVSQLQKDLEQLSLQVLSMYETNEKLIKQDLVESSQPSYIECAEIGQNQNQNSEGSHLSKLLEFQSHCVGATKQNMGGDILLEDLKRSLHLQEGLYRKLEEEACELHFQNVYLDVFSKTLQQTLLEASAEIRLMKERVEALTRQLDLSNESNELLMQRLQSAMDDIHFLNESKAACFAKCSDMALQNQILEANIQGVTNDNHLLRQKITEWESVMVEFASFKSKYEAITAEKADLENLLEKESQEKSILQHDISSLQQNLKTLKTEFEEQAFAYENMQNTVNFQQNKLQNLLSSYVKGFNDLSLCSESVGQKLECENSTDIALQLEELQQNAFKKLHQLTEEKRSLTKEKDIAEASLSKMESEIVLMKQKFEHDKKVAVDQLDELGTIKTEFDELTSLNKDMQHTLNFLQNKMQNLLSSYEKDFNESFLCSETVDQESGSKDLKDAALRLEQFQNQALEKIHQLTIEKTFLTNEKDNAEASLSKMEAQIMLMEQKFEHENREVVVKLDEFGTIKTELDELTAMNKNLQNTFNFLQNEMQILLSSYENSFNELSLRDESVGQGLKSKDLKDIVLHVQKLQQNTFEKIHQLMEEKNSLIVEKDMVQASLSKMESDVALMKQKYEHDKREIVDKLDELGSIKTEFEELAAVNENLQNTINFVQNLMQNLLSSSVNLLNELSFDNESVGFDFVPKDLTDVVLQLEKLQQNTHEKIHQLVEEKKALTDERDDVQLSLNKADNDILLMKQKFKHDVREIGDKLYVSDILVQKLHLKVEALADKLKVSSEVDENYAKQHRELFSDLDGLELELHQLSSKTRDFTQEILALETEEVRSSKQTIAALTEENQSLKVLLQKKSEEYALLALEVDTSKESLQSQNDELHVERSLRDKSDSVVEDLKAQLYQKQQQLVDFDEHKSELVHLKQLVSDMELEKSRSCDLLLQYQESQRLASETCSSICSLESQLSEMHELLIAADVKVIFTQMQHEAWFDELLKRVHSSDKLFNDLRMENLDVENALKNCLTREAQSKEENGKLLAGLDALRSEFHTSIVDNRALLDKNSILRAELDECKRQAESTAVNLGESNNQLTLEVERLKHLSLRSEEEIGDLMLSREDLEVQLLVFKAKLDEQSDQIDLLGGYNDEIVKLRKQCDELSRKLSDQSLKAEEFKNLSIHLKELKDKSEAECIQLREKKDSEGGPPTAAAQESLRIAFIKEQCETKMQELKQQLSISKKHGEELLWKLQDAIDEIENRKKSEASHLKKNEELGVKLLELEAELQELISDKREKTNSYDLLKAELECSLMSLECCKEEKEKLESSLSECNEEKLKISAELTLMNELLNSSKVSILNEGSAELCKESGTCDEIIGRNVNQNNPVASTSNRGRITEDAVSSDDSAINVYSVEQDQTLISEDARNTCLVPVDDGSPSQALVHIQPQQVTKNICVQNILPYMFSLISILYI